MFVLLVLQPPPIKNPAGFAVCVRTAILKTPTFLSEWLQVFQISEEQLKPVYSRHFPDGDPSKGPDSSLGKRFSSPIKKGPEKKRGKYS